MWHDLLIDCSALSCEGLLLAYPRWLSPDELHRAEKLHRPEDRTLFLAGRVGVRRLLADYHSLNPCAVTLAANAFGKPILREAPLPDLDFSISHAWPYTLIAVSRGCAVGVDIENAGRDIDPQRLWRRFFAAAEVATLEALPAKEQRDAFFELWTLKEAYIKAVGEGLSLGLDSFTVHRGVPPHTAAPAHGGTWTLAHTTWPGSFHAAAACLSSTPLPSPIHLDITPSIL